MKTEEKAKKVQNIATALAAIFGAVGAFLGIFQAQVSADLKNQVTSLQNASQQTIVNVISTLGDDAQAADLAQSGDVLGLQLPFDYDMLLTPVVLTWYIATELGSILENAAEMGVPVPPVLREVLEKVHKASDRKDTTASAGHLDE